MNRFIRTQLSFELRLYNFGKTWITQNLDSVCYQHIRVWLELPISCCIKEVATLPKSKCGLGIPSFSEEYERLWLRKRYTLLNNKQPEMQRIWNESSHSHVEIDSLLNTSENIRTAMASMKIQARKPSCNSLVFPFNARHVDQNSYGKHTEDNNFNLVRSSELLASIFVQLHTKGLAATASDSWKSIQMEERRKSKLWSL